LKEVDDEMDKTHLAEFKNQTDNERQRELNVESDRREQQHKSPHQVRDEQLSVRESMSTAVARELKSRSRELGLSGFHVLTGFQL